MSKPLAHLLIVHKEPTADIVVIVDPDSTQPRSVKFPATTSMINILDAFAIGDGDSVITTLDICDSSPLWSELRPAIATGNMKRGRSS